jgi:glycogen phosphorylase
LTSCLEAGQPTTESYVHTDAWVRTAILNVASCGKFSSDGTIAEYAADCPVPVKRN